jgi:hypothetical protein
MNERQGNTMENEKKSIHTASGADWASILTQVASIGINLLGSLVLSTNHVGYYEQGDILWLQTGDDILAFNAGQGPVGLSYAKSGVQMVEDRYPIPYAVSEYQVLEKNSQTSQADMLTTFQDGALCIGKVNSPVSATANTAAVSFSVALLSFNVPVNVIKGLTLTIEQSQDNQLFQAVLASTGPVIQNASVTVKDARGGTFTASSDFTSLATAPGDYLYKVTFPQGVDLSPIVESLNMTLAVERASFMRATEESRQRLTYGLPEELRACLPERVRARL